MNEQRIIGVIANNPNQFVIAKDLISRDMIVDKTARLIWDEMLKLSSDGLLPGSNYLHKTIGEYASEWLHIAAEQAIGDEVIPYCRLLIKERKSEDLRGAINRAADMSDPAPFLLAEIEKFYASKNNASQSFKDLIIKTADHIDMVTDGGSGIMTGLMGIDDQMGGLQPQRLLIVAARTGVGKTALTMQIALNIAQANIHVGVCSLEMGDAELGMRSIAYTCQADISGLYKADDNALTKMSSGMKSKRLVEWPVHFNTEQYHLGEICSQIRLWAREGAKVVVVDHIGLVEVPEANSANERLGMVTRTLKKLAKELDISMILVSQLNRANDKENRMPRLSDLRDSGSIEQDADMVLLMHKVMGQGGEYANHVFIMAKNRQGATGLIPRAYRFDGSVQTFFESEICNPIPMVRAK